MWCPLCKAEYRTGFERCTDCRLKLVQTFEEAQSTKKILLWRGTRLSRFNAIVDELNDANIPNHAESGATPERKHPWWAFIGIVRAITQAKDAADNMSWKVFVLESDYAAARALVEDKQV